MRLGFLGSSEISLKTLKILNENKCEIVKVWTNEDKAHKRSKKLIPTPVKQYSIDNNLNVSTKPIDKQDLQSLKIDAMIVVSYGHIVSQEILDTLSGQFFNLHFSLLPKYRGPSPVQTSILNGEKVTGLTIFEITKMVDEGPIIAQIEEKIYDGENSSELLERLSIIGANFVLDTYKKGLLNKSNKNRSKQIGEATYTQKFEKRNGEIDFSDDPIKNLNKIRAYTSNPSAWYIENGKRIIISKARVVDNKLELLEVKPEGKNFMKYQDYLRGIR